MMNDEHKRFLGIVGKVNRTNIVLKFKPNGYFKRELFFTWRKCYVINICTVYEFSKKFTYILMRWRNFQYNAHIFAFII